MALVPALTSELMNAAIAAQTAHAVSQSRSAARAAGTAARVAYDAGPAARAAANRIKRMWRRSRERRQKVHQANRIGMNPRSSGAKKDGQLNTALTNYSDCAINLIEVTNIDKTTTNAINQRQGNACYFSGIKLHMRLYNNYISGGSEPLKPLKFHIAVVSPVRGKVISDDGWFRDFFTSRDKNFTTTLDDIEYDDPVNSDKYLVHWRRSMLVGPPTRQSNNTDWVGGPSYKEMTQWIPVKRNIRFNDDSTEECETPVFVVWWAKVAGNGPGQVLNAYKASMRIVSYFHESLPSKRLILH